ncbi:hypothetical protein SLEP1_g23717 [Rubroshorea leprosula]|uniref:Leucine-rich repeat-containing N-terminal plant-type domain-containing protein n=1 Tax=Rubroshorea leprosula TaxID=152421 RepID=A0AAV5JNP2_9ROSI|nr:hypothetical protein SLEP1_g23717 [Rubroshorea leprosula]
MMFFGRASPQLVCALVILLHAGSAVGFNSTSGAAGVRCIGRERQALLMFKQSLVDEQGVLSTWGSEERRKDCCSWTGVKCSNRTGHVIWLDLHDKSLSGTLSPSLFELQYLTYLNLCLNDIGSICIPESISSLKRLKFLDLSANRLIGSLPSLLGNLTSLLHLDLGFNEFHSVENLEWLYHLSFLKYLDLSGIDLSKVNNWLQVVNKLPHLTNLYLSSCNLLDVVPEPLPMNNSSISLAVLELSYNNLTAAMFQWLFNFSNSLVYLDLSYNQLQGLIPEAFGKMIFLEGLSLSDNQFEGGIQKSFGNMCKLRLLDLSYNNLEGMLPEFFGDLSGCLELTLESLYIISNSFMGPLPDAIRNFSSLKVLFLSDNALNGTVPNLIGLLSELECLYLGGNSFNGVITEAHFSKLSKLKGLALSSNFLRFNISPDWIPPFQLDFIFLRSCKLGPKFPKWLQTQRSFLFLDISRNEISDSIPDWFWKLSSGADQINISSNLIYGILPYFSMKFSGYPGIDLSHNKLEGPLPLFPANMSSLSLFNNGFSGNISSLCSVTGNTFQLLDISFNQLSGELPDCMASWSNLMILNLGHNHLFGKIPIFIGSLNMLETLVLRNNSFSGEIPWSLGDCNHLQFVDMSHNNFSGPLPGWIGERLVNLTYLLLRSNNFYGDIPLRLCQLTKMMVLDFSNNTLCGNIPWCIDNMTALTKKENLVDDHWYVVYVRNNMQFATNYGDKAYIVWKGTEYEFAKNLNFLRLIDLSSNKLTGEIPQQICSLFELVQLNLSRNQLTGRIPADIGQMKSLESLDLSRNQLSGQLPSSMSQLNFLNTLNLSNNNFYGRIPVGTQLQTFSPYAFAGNSALCGPPLTPTCSEDEKPSAGGGRDSQDDGDEFWKGFKPSMELGMAFGFLGVLALKLDHPWKHVCILLFNYMKIPLNNLKGYLCLIVAAFGLVVTVNATRLRRKLRF